MSKGADALVIGAGPAGLFAAERLAMAGWSVRLVDRMPGPGRKFLVAGRGGLNLTHSEPLDRFVSRYRGSYAPVVSAAVRAFPPEALRAWASGLGVETFVGSSGRVFPVEMRATPLLRAWMARLEGLGVVFEGHTNLVALDADGVILDRPRGRETVSPELSVLALGGASWPRTGSDGAWVPVMRDAGITVRTLAPANCGFVVEWSTEFAERFGGEPLKGIGLRHGTRQRPGELIISARGIEGGVVYAASAGLREALEVAPSVTIEIDLRHGRSSAEIRAGAGRDRPGDSLSNRLRRVLHCSPLEVALVREVLGQGWGELAARPSVAELIAFVRALPIRLVAPYSIDRAISSAGGIERRETPGSPYVVAGHPNVVAIGEMLDWEAPTGGYLLQGCFATAADCVARLDHP